MQRAIKSTDKQAEKRKLLAYFEKKYSKSKAKDEGQLDFLVYLLKQHKKAFSLDAPKRSFVLKLAKKLEMTPEEAFSHIFEAGITEMSRTHVRDTQEKNQAKITHAFKSLLRHNNTVKSYWDKVFINAATLEKVAGASHRHVQDFLTKEENKKLLQKHHDKHHLNPSHNRLKVKMKEKYQ